MWRFVVLRFVPIFAAANLLWETLQLPLYTLWLEAPRSTQVFAVVHCTVGDILIGTSSLLLAVMLCGRHVWPPSRHGAVVTVATLLGVAYTVASEWLNTQIRFTWQYTEAMPLLPPFDTGLSPLLQWLVIPPLAYAVALRNRGVSSSE